MSAGYELEREAEGAWERWANDPDAQAQEPGDVVPWAFRAGFIAARALDVEPTQPGTAITFESHTGSTQLAIKGARHWRTTVSDERSWQALRQSMKDGRWEVMVVQSSCVVQESAKAYLDRVTVAVASEWSVESPTRPGVHPGPRLVTGAASGEDARAQAKTFSIQRGSAAAVGPDGERLEYVDGSPQIEDPANVEAYTVEMNGSLFGRYGYRATACGVAVELSRAHGKATVIEPDGRRAEFSKGLRMPEMREKA